MSTSQAISRPENQPVSFPDWKDALERAGIPAGQRGSFRREILAFLHHCKIRRAPATIVLAKEYLAASERQGANGPREALRWFFRTAPVVNDGPQTGLRGEMKAGEPPALPGQKVPAVARLATEGRLSATSVQISLSPSAISTEASSRGQVDRATGARQPNATGASHPQETAGPEKRRGDVPPAAAQDRGGADWERDLITALRERGLLWRTEETYRGWAARFATFLAPRSPYAAETRDVGAFLSMLAVTQRASRSTQKQALNAIVFLMQEALKRQLGEINFRRAKAAQMIPTVLSRDECGRLFGQLTGTTRLMAELAYGAGLRLLELLRLRVHHLDLARQQLQVYDGKGAKHRLTVLPAILVPGLAAHLDRLRVLYAEDRAAHLPGVWLREGLARKYAQAGETWEWPRIGCTHAV